MSKEEIIKELDKVINNNKDKAFMTGELNYVAMAESCKFKILDLQDRLQQKENIIKEVREYIEKKEKDNDNWMDYELLIEPIRIKEILDKDGDKECQ